MAVNDQDRELTPAGRTGPAAGREHERAESDYQRLRSAYLKLANDEWDNDVGLAMIGADMERAHALLQCVAGLTPLPGTSAPHAALLRGSQRFASHEP